MIKSLLSKIEKTFALSRPLLYGQLPPSESEFILTLEEMGIPLKIYQDAYYSNEKDVPPRPREYAGREFRLKSDTVPFLPDFDPSGDGSSALRVKRQSWWPPTTLRVWEIAQPPPSPGEVDEWLKSQQTVTQEIRTEIPNAHVLSQVFQRL